MTRSNPVISGPLLSRVPIPLPGEHVAGYLRRLVAMNRLPSLRYMALLLKVRDIAPRSSDELWDRLISALGVPPSFVEPLRWRIVPGSTRRWVSFLGNDVHETFLHHMTLRLCRGCVAETGTIFNVWSLRHVTACPKHGTRLSETCPGCGKRLRFIDALTAWGCNTCGADYRYGAEEPADEQEVALSASLVGAAMGLKPAPLPWRLRLGKSKPPRASHDSGISRTAGPDERGGLHPSTKQAILPSGRHRSSHPDHRTSQDSPCGNGHPRRLAKSLSPHSR